MSHAYKIERQWFQAASLAQWFPPYNNWYRRVRSFSGRLTVRYETDDFLIKTAINGRDLLPALELRHRIFAEEWRGESEFHGLDVDEYDFHADHLLIIEKATSDVIGTYRLLSSQATKSFYSENEFEISCFLRRPDVKLELGRACIREPYRNGHTIDLLWKGLAAYIKASKARYLFGCASVRETNPIAVARLLRYIEAQGKWSRDHQIWPTRDYRMINFCLEDMEPLLAPEAKTVMPPLLRTYLQAGAKVYGYPAFDREFSCIDLFTVLDMKELSPKFEDRFFTRTKGV